MIQLCQWAGNQIAGLLIQLCQWAGNNAEHYIQIVNRQVTIVPLQLAETSEYRGSQQDRHALKQAGSSRPGDQDGVECQDHQDENGTDCRYGQLDGSKKDSVHETEQLRHHISLLLPGKYMLDTVEAAAGQLEELEVWLIGTTSLTKKPDACSPMQEPEACPEVRQRVDYTQVGRRRCQPGGEEHIEAESCPIPEWKKELVNSQVISTIPDKDTSAISLSRGVKSASLSTGESWEGPKNTFSQLRSRTGLELSRDMPQQAEVKGDDNEELVGFNEVGGSHVVVPRPQSIHQEPHENLQLAVTVEDEHLHVQACHEDEGDHVMVHGPKHEHLGDVHEDIKPFCEDTKQELASPFRVSTRLKAVGVQDRRVQPEDQVLQHPGPELPPVAGDGCQQGAVVGQRAQPSQPEDRPQLFVVSRPQSEDGTEMHNALLTHTAMGFTRNMPTKDMLTFPTSFHTSDGPVHLYQEIVLLHGGQDPELLMVLGAVETQVLQQVHRKSIGQYTVLTELDHQEEIGQVPAYDKEGLAGVTARDKSTIMMRENVDEELPLTCDEDLQEAVLLTRQPTMTMQHSRRRTEKHLSDQTPGEMLEKSQRVQVKSKLDFPDRDEFPHSTPEVHLGLEKLSMRLLSKNRLMGKTEGSTEVDIMLPETDQSEIASPVGVSPEDVYPVSQSTMSMKHITKRAGKELVETASDDLEEEQRAKVNNKGDSPDSGDSSDSLLADSGAWDSSEDLFTNSAVVCNEAANLLTMPGRTCREITVNREQVIVSQLELPDTAEAITDRMVLKHPSKEGAPSRGKYCKNTVETITEVTSLEYDLPGTAGADIDCPGVI